MQHTNTSSMTAATRLQVYFVETSLHLGTRFAVAHDEERRAFERLGKRAGQKAQVAKFGEPVALGICRFRDGSGM